MLTIKSQSIKAIKPIIKKDILCLGIETSCDDTSIAIIKANLANLEEITFSGILQNFEILSSVVSSQIAIHAQYGGVIPEIGARQHTTNFQSVLIEAVNTIENGKDIKEKLLLIDIIAVTTNPGLASALKVGIEQAKALQYFIMINTGKEVPIVNVNHLHGHIASSFMNKEVVDYLKAKNLYDSSLFPHINLLVSGGNTQLLLLKSWRDITIVGKTLDDAAGECLDKTGRMIGFKYPGGISISKTAKETENNVFELNKAMIKGLTVEEIKHVINKFPFSFSGLKTQVRYICQNLNDSKNNIKKIPIPEDFKYENYLTNEELYELFNSETQNSAKLEYVYNMAVSIQTTVVEQLYRQSNKCCKYFSPNTFGISGGVSANPLLRNKAKKIAKSIEKSNPLPPFVPPLKFTGDNAAMIALAGLFNYYL